MREGPRRRCQLWIAIALAVLAACSGGDSPPDAITCERVCGAAGGTCDGEVCRIVGTGEELVSCPTGIPCEVVCTHLGQPCRDGVRCAGATTCTVTCVGARACQAGVNCGASDCTVTCKGDEACEAGIQTSGGACTSHCCGVDACAFGTESCLRDDRCP